MEIKDYAQLKRQAQIALMQADYILENNDIPEKLKEALKIKKTT